MLLCIWHIKGTRCALNQANWLFWPVMVNFWRREWITNDKKEKYDKSNDSFIVLGFPSRMQVCGKTRNI
jgi:hypothetical protein